MVIGFMIRSGLVVGALYYTRQLGVWGSTEDSQRLYDDVKEEISPHLQSLQKQLPFEVPALPQRGEIRFLTKHYYNEGVKQTFHFIHMIPCYTGQLIKKVRDALDQFSEPPKPVASLRANKKQDS